MRTYYIEKGNFNRKVSRVRADKNHVICDYGDSGSDFIRFSERDDSFIYEWYKGKDSGRYLIPKDIALELPELLMILNDASNGTLCTPKRIYREKPSIELFPDSKD